jgi:hypothetical protein
MQSYFLNLNLDAKNQAWPTKLHAKTYITNTVISFDSANDFFSNKDLGYRLMLYDIV